MTPVASRVISLLRGTDALRRAALALVVLNVGIVITGGAVRLTGSGLGCPTVPRCTDDSYFPTAALGINGVIEFSNRMLTFVLGLAAVLGFVCAVLHRPRDRRVLALGTGMLLVIPVQAGVGMLTVASGLNPWVVAGHFGVSIGIIAAAYAFWRATLVVSGRTTESAPVPAPLGRLATLILVASAAVLAVGTLVTGSGPHAGDAQARRNGLDLESIAQVHVDLVCLLIGASVAAWFALRAVGARPASVRAAWLIGIIAAQGLVGMIQYLTNLPPILVGAHMAGACAVWLATLSLWRATHPATTHTPPPAAASPHRDLAHATT
jgi:cytochrome c oxidase assembly protein subunit 15